MVRLRVYIGLGFRYVRFCLGLGFSLVRLWVSLGLGFSDGLVRYNSVWGSGFRVIKRV